MNVRARLISALLLCATPALAQSAAPAPAAEQANAAPTIQVDFRGSLRDALKKIAEVGGLNLVVTGDLDRPAEVHLKGVTAERALRTVAKAYNLKLDADEGIYTLRPLTEAEIAARPAPTAPLAPPAPRAPEAPVPPTPPNRPEELGNLGDEAVSPEEVKERVRETVRRVKRSRSGDNDVVARGQSLTINKDQSVESAVVYSGNLKVDGMVEDDAVVFGGNMEVNGHIAGDATAFGGNIVLNPGASVEGDVASFGGVVERREGAHVAGSSESFGGSRFGTAVAQGVKDALVQGKEEAESEAAAELDDSDEGDHDGGMNGFASFLLQFGLLFGLGFLFMIFAPTRMKEIEAEIKREPVKSGLVGLLGLIALGPLSLLLIITLIGIPVAFALWVVAGLGLAMGFAALANQIGMRIPLLRGRKTQAAVLALGLLPMLLLFQIPVLGAIAFALGLCISAGAVIRTRIGQRGRGMPEPIIPSPSAL